MDSPGDPVNILWSSNAPWASSGYAEQTALFTRRLRAVGHDVSIAANWGLNEVITTWEGFTVYPCQPGDWGMETIPVYAEHCNADLVIALVDAHVLNNDEWPADLNLAIWAPVDHDPMPPPVLATFLETLEPAARKNGASPGRRKNVRPIAMSRFGEQQMRRFKLDPLYVPHGYDPEVFKPAPELRDEIRDTAGIPHDAFLAVMVAANKGEGVARKAFPQAFQAFANLQKKHSNSYLYVHTNAEGGMDLNLLRKAIGIPDGHLLFPSKEARLLTMSNQVVARFYQAADVLLLPSMGEGFGVPLIEAQACGCPVITSNHSAMKELGQAGWIVDGDPWWDAAAKSFFFMPFIQSITDVLEEAYEERGNQAWKDAAVEFAAPYNANLVTVDHWLPALERLAPQPESRQVRRARERKAAKQLAKVGG